MGHFVEVIDPNMFIALVFCVKKEIEESLILRWLSSLHFILFPLFYFFIVFACVFIFKVIGVFTFLIQVH